MKKVILALLFSSTLVQANDVDSILDSVADKHGVPRSVVHAVAMVESTKRCGINNGPHKGIMQVSRGAAKEVGVNWPPRNCWDEVEMGVRYLKRAIDKVGDNCIAYTLYNRGLYASRFCSDYGRKVLKFKKKYEGV